MKIYLFIYFNPNESLCILKDIDIKKVNGVPQYAFVQYSDIASVCKAIKKMDGEYLGSNRLKVFVLIDVAFYSLHLSQLATIVNVLTSL